MGVEVALASVSRCIGQTGTEGRDTKIADTETVKRNAKAQGPATCPPFGATAQTDVVAVTPAWSQAGSRG